ncbi:TPA: ATP-binding protein [Enterobacter cloacae]
MNENELPAFWPAQGNLHDGRVFVLKEDVIFTVLAQEGGISWMNARHPHSGGSFIIATAVSDEEEERATRLLKNEFALRDHLQDSWAIRAVASTQYRGRFALVYAPFSFELLARRAGRAISGIARFIELAIQICTPLRQMHLQNLIHGDIKPGNIFVHHDSTCRLGSFGLSCSISGAFSQTRLAVSGGTPAYMSPEHTTRTQRAVDCRSDLYSLGIVLYELLTGRLPFDLGESEQTNWAHYHIASEPLSPAVLRPDVPDMLSTIILKLLEKQPDNRYQTVDGLIADLRRCQATLTSEGEIVAFTPGQQDRTPAIHLADSLFAAHPQANDVIAAFERVGQNIVPELVTIGGPSGIGKSSIIATALKTLQQRRVLLAVGKVDQFSPTLPYGVLSSAFRTLTLHLLGLPAEEVAKWKIRLARALEGYEELAVSLVPELGLLLESKPRFSADTFSIDARARFSHMVLALVKTFASQGCPLVLLLDDLQWSDAASLQTLKHLLATCGAIPLLLVVAHRDIASLSDPALQQQLASLPASAQHAIEIIPQPLTVKAVARWLGTLFRVRSATTTDLATLIHEKTGGNPLFVHEFFRRIVDDGLVVHNKYQDKWQYDLQAIRARHYTENVVTLVLEKLEEMPDETRRLLGSIACLGGTGELEMLCRVVGMSVAEIRYALHPAVMAQLIVLTEKAYAFTHDRVQEAAFALLDQRERSHLHLTTASLLAEAARQAAGNELLFRAVHHVTAALDSIQPAPQRQMFRELSLLAARRAKRTGDYHSALSYIQTARALGNAGAVSDFMLDIEEAGCEFALGHLERTRELCDAILGCPGGLTEKALAANLLVEVYIRQSDSRLALEAALCWLGIFGIQISHYPEDVECDEAWKHFCNRVGDAPQQQFVQLSQMDNPQTEAVMNLLYSASICASFICPRLHFLLLCRMMHLTLDHGITGASTTAMAWFGVLIGQRYAEYRLGFQYGTLARELVNRHGYDAFEAKTLLPLDQLSVWTQPLSFTIECAKACFTAAVTHGDMTVACFAACHQVINFLSRGDHLDGVLTSIDRGLAFVRKTHFQDIETILMLQRGYVEFLRTPVIGTWSAAQVLPEAMLPAAPEQAPEQTSLMLGEQISHTGSWRWELEQDLMFISEEYARILGLPEQQKKISMAEFLTFVHQDDYARISTIVTQSVREGLSMRAEFRINRTDGSTRYILGIGDPVGVGSEVNEYYGIITDITSQRAAEDAMRVAQADLARVSRATTVGQLTSSIAHEINQPLMSIVSNAGASLRWLNREPARLDKVREGLEEIAAEGARAGEIIRSIQSLTRKQDPTFSRIDLHYLVHHIIALSRSELEQRHISVDYLLQAQDSFITGDSVQIQQVLLNLVMNAVEAMAEVKDRSCTITISTSNAEGRVLVEIADTGSGIEPERLEKIFDSFYSTKAQGMGMGLTISASIIERHCGKLSARRREPHGTVFAFTLPLAAQEG